MLLLRSIRKAKWYKNSYVKWLPDGEVQADALGDLSTTGNSLSVWHIEDDYSNLTRVIAALSSKRNFLVNFDYTIFDISDFLKSGLKIKNSTGDTPDLDANKKWHFDLYELSVQTLVQVTLFIRNNSIIDRAYPIDVAKAVSDSLTINNFDVQKVHRELLIGIRTLIQET